MVDFRIDVATVYLATGNFISLGGAQLSCLPTLSSCY